IKCYYCGEDGHIQYHCRKFKEDLMSFKKFKEKVNLKERKSDFCATTTDCDSDGKIMMVKGMDNSLTCVNDNRWFLDSVASMHICKDKDCFITLNVDRDFGCITVGNKERLKIESVGSACFKLHTGDVKTLHHVRYIYT
ncbi:hypothetical protein CFOL_v3_23397, partial [Cephalotus follicularis]